MLPIPKKTRPPKDTNAEQLYAETETLKLPPPEVATGKPLEQKEITHPLTRRHRKGGYPHLLGPPGVKKTPLYFIDRCKEIADQFIKINRPGKAKQYLDTCAFYDPKDPDTLYKQAVYHSQFSEYDLTLAKVEECLKQNEFDYKAMLLKADTCFRMCDFENALQYYRKGISLKLPYRDWFQDGYYRTTALLHNITNGKFPMFYGGNMRVFYRLVQGQERGGGYRIFNDTYKHYDELFPLEPNLTGLQEEINMFHVSKPRPPDHVQRRIKKAAVQQLKSSKKILGGFWNHKLEVEKHLIKKEYLIPYTGLEDKTEHIERALKFLKNRIDRFEVICAMMKNGELRKSDKRVDWLKQYGKWMAADKVPSVIPPAKTGGLMTSRYRWALSQTLFDLRNQTLDVCWVRTTRRQKRKYHLFSQRRPWRYYCGYRSAKEGALAVIKVKAAADDWNFMRKLYRNVLADIEESAPEASNLPPPKHIRAIEEQISTYKRSKESVPVASHLEMPKTEKDNRDKLYYDPDSAVQQWEKNRAMLRTAILKNDDRPGFLPPTNDNRPIPANLLEIFESRVHDDPDAWDKRREWSRDLRESLAKAEATRALTTFPPERQPMFVQIAATTKDAGKGKDKPRTSSDLEEVDSGATIQPDKNSIAESAADKAKRSDDADDEEIPAAPLKAERKARKLGSRYKYHILDKKSEVDYMCAPHAKRRTEIKVEQTVAPVIVQTVDDDNEKTAAQLEAERLLAVKAEDPLEIARRNFDNQKAMFLDKAYNTLMTCTKVSEFIELETEMGDLLESTFPPKNMRFPNGDPIILEGYPSPAPLTKPPISEYFANRNKLKQKKKPGLNDDTASAPETGHDPASD